MAIERLVFLSDLHLSIGGGYNVEHFHADSEFAALLQLPELTPKDSDQLQLVLLGDTFDIWRTALADTEYTADSTSTIPVAYDEASEINRLDRIRNGHPDFFKVLADFVSRRNCILVIVPGNHDHSLINLKVQNHVRSLAGDTGQRIQFVFNYDAPAFGLYAIHGNQGDKNNRYVMPQFFSWQDECAGYYFVRLFLNRLETREPGLDESPGGWRTIWHYLRKALKPSLLAAAIKYWVQYRRDARVAAAIALGPDVAEDGPDLLAADKTQPGYFFSKIPEVEQAFRLDYHQYEEVRQVVDELRGAAGGIPAPEMTRAQVETAAALAGRGTADLVALGEAEDVEYAEQVLRSQQQAHPGTYRYLLFGHTHNRLEHPVRDSDSDWCFNTGTWSGTAQQRPLTVVIAERDGGQARVSFGRFHNGGISLGAWR